jgi:hypothetical protein
VLLRYFGEDLNADHRCGNCSACSGGTAQVGVAAAEDEAIRAFKGYRSTLEAGGPLTARLFAQFLGGSSAQGVPKPWRELNGYGVLSQFRIRDLRKLADRVLNRVRLADSETLVSGGKVAQTVSPNEDGPGEEPPAPDRAPQSVIERSVTVPRAESADDGDDAVFWRSKDRSFTLGELKRREVARARGLAILGLIGENADRFAPSMAVAVLRGGAQSPPSRSPEMKALPQYGALRSVTYGELLADILAMHAKGYLCRAHGKTKKLSLTDGGLAALRGADKSVNDA